MVPLVPLGTGFVYTRDRLGFNEVECDLLGCDERASEASSAWFPRVVEHLCMALPLLPGRYVIV